MIFRLTPYFGALTAIAAGVAIFAATQAAGVSAPATMVLDASAFFEHMPKGTIITQAPSRQLPADAWLFNNTGLVMRSQAYLYANVDVPEPGTYHLFVRSHGAANTSFRVSVGDKQTSAIFGNEPLTLKAGGSFPLKKGRTDVVLSRVVLGQSVGSTFDVLVLTKKTDFNENDLRPLELQPDVALLKEYTIPRSSSVKFGDVDGDGKSDFFVLTGNYGGHMFNHAGRELWSYQNPEEGARQRGGFEAPGLVWDFDRDGLAEAVHYRLADGKEWLVVSDGRTGAAKFTTEWPARPLPHEYNNFRLAAAKLSGDYPTNIVVFTDSGGEISITAYTKDLKQLWQHMEKKKKDHLGHYVYPVDLNNDGIDEVSVSGLVLNATGKVLWNRFDLLDDNHDHCDSLRFFDIDGDGQVEILAPVSEFGVMVFRALTGELLWRHAAEHTQQLEVGNFRRGVPPPQIAVNARTYARNGEAGLGGQVHWFDARGNLLSKWPANPLNGNPDFVKGDWKGDGVEELFWYKFRLNEQGKGVLYFKQDVYHMFDFMGAGSEQVIARGGGSLLVYGYKHAKPKPVKRGYQYQRKVANHTHY
ncbi:MAG: hypothetical protein JJE04_00900 [Acidobacteriia bacterium]|nr:hypothetical protein [Terriglobia bacterium]